MGREINMSRALIISWYKYHPHVGEGHRVLFEHWLKLFPLWAKEIDALYLIDQEMDFTLDDEKRLKAILPNTQILKSEVASHHWGQFKWILPKIKEDYMLFLDNDVVITRPGIVDGWFKHLEEGADFVGSFDGSGGLKEQIQSKFPYFKMADVTRMGSYYFGFTRELINKINPIDFAPITYPVGTYIPELDYTTKEGDWSDSFGLFTLKMLGAKAKIIPIPDPRETIYLQEDEYSISKIRWSWKISAEPKDPNLLGYYHIRNGNLANYVLSSKLAGNMEDYTREISSVKRELLRILAWYNYMDSQTLNAFQPQINQLLYDLGVDLEDWVNYMIEFVDYHDLP